MSPAAKFRNGEKTSEKGHGKERKTSTRVSSGGTGMPANAYNPVSGTFHILDTSAPDPGISSQSGRFRSIDDTVEISSVIGSYSEYDSMSNNGSCSGESEDQSQLALKDKRTGIPPRVVGGGSDKREKIRCKNEKKHQRQKERRAQELKDRCTVYLMSRKLEGLVQQLVAMGFSTDRATMALILNEGLVERSVAWLLEGGEGQVKENWNAEGNLKIDISEELARIADLEIRLKYPRVEIERAIVVKEGNLDKAAELLREKFPHSSVPASEYTCISQDRVKEQTKNASEGPPYLVNGQGRGSGIFHALSFQRREEKDLQPAQSRSQISSPALSPSTAEVTPSHARTLPQCGTEWQRLSTSVEGKQPSPMARSLTYTAQSTPHSFPSLVRHMQDSRGLPSSSGPPSRREPNFVHVTARDSGVVESPVTPPPPIRSASTCSSPSLSPTSWHGSLPGVSSPSSVFYFNTIPAGDVLFKKGSEISLSEALGRCGEDTLRQLQTNRLDAMSSAWGSGAKHTFGSVEVPLPSSSAPSSVPQTGIQPPSAITGWGAGLPGGPLDWSMWVSSGVDYKTIDWSVASPTSSEGVWGVSSSLASMLNLSDSGKSSVELAREPTLYTVTGRGDGLVNSLSQDPWIISDRNRSLGLGLQEKSLSETSSSTGLAVPEWTSPFAGKDLFTLPYEAVPSQLL